MEKQRPQTLIEAGAELHDAVHILWLEIVKALRLETIVQFCQKKLRP